MKLIKKSSLSLEASKILTDIAKKKALEMGVGAAIAVVDEGGHLICLERLDGTMVGASNIAIGKAATSICFKRPGIILENTVSDDRPAMGTLNSSTPFPYVPLKGSYPIEFEGDIIGALAIAGAGTGENDEFIASFTIKQFGELLSAKSEILFSY